MGVVVPLDSSPVEVVAWLIGLLSGVLIGEAEGVLVVSLGTRELLNIVGVVVEILAVSVLIDCPDVIIFEVSEEDAIVETAIEVSGASVVDAGLLGGVPIAALLVVLLDTAEELEGLCSCSLVVD